MRPAYLTIDKKAFTHNLKKVREFAPHSQIVAALKANAYGHGAVDLFKETAINAHMIGVACIEEALELRHQNCTLPIVLLEGFYHPQELKLITEYNLETASFVFSIAATCS